MATEIIDRNISTLIGLTMAKVEVKTNSDGDDVELIFTSTDGRVFKFYHEQDCCEQVYIESIVGDLNDLVGSPIVIADESSNDHDPDGDAELGYYHGTWTFYKFATIKGYVDVRWLGESNGYYSESVDFGEVVTVDDAPTPTYSYQPETEIDHSKWFNNGQYHRADGPAVEMAKEMTVAEVEKLLGYPVKIVK